MICYLYPEPIYFFFSSDVPDLLYYSHIPTGLIALLVGLYVFFNNPKSLISKLLLIMTFLFFTWICINLTAWTNINAEIIAFLWPMYGIISGLLSVVAVYFVYIFVKKEDVPFFMRIIFLILLLPLFIFAPTNLSISGFDITVCDAFVFEGMLFKMYYSALGVISLLWMFKILVDGYKTANHGFRKQIILVGLGVEIFIFLFFFVTVAATYLVNWGILNDSSLELYGLFGILFFILSVAVVIVRYQAFNIRLAAPVALVVGLWLLVFSLLFIRQIEIVQVVVSITLLLFFIFGYALIKSIKREIKHREQIESLAQKLKNVNNRLRELDKQKSEFVSIASHQLRSPLTAISGYASMLKEGEFGNLPAKSLEPIERIHTSARNMSESIEEYLNISRIESGNMKYNFTDFNLRDEVEHVCDDLRSEAIRKGLLLFFSTDISSRAIVHADLGKLIQAIHNLINNSIKYTEKGAIKVLVRDNQKEKRIYVEVSDTGIGMSEETLDTIFQKFERADNAGRVNIKGTGLGLYTALRLIEAMDGTIVAYSEGEGRGSKFVLELPLMM